MIILYMDSIVDTTIKPQALPCLYYKNANLRNVNSTVYANAWGIEKIKHQPMTSIL